MLNYGVAIASNGDWQVIDTFYGAGIRDEYSSITGKTFTLFVAPREYIDQLAKLNPNSANYLQRREIFVSNTPSVIKAAILNFFL